MFVLTKMNKPTSATFEEHVGGIFEGNLILGQMLKTLSTIFYLSNLTTKLKININQLMTMCQRNMVNYEYTQPFQYEHVRYMQYTCINVHAFADDFKMVLCGMHIPKLLPQYPFERSDTCEWLFN